VLRGGRQRQVKCGRCGAVLERNALVELPLGTELTICRIAATTHMSRIGGIGTALPLTSPRLPAVDNGRLDIGACHDGPMSASRPLDSELVPARLLARDLSETFPGLSLVEIIDVTRTVGVPLYRTDAGHSRFARADIERIRAAIAKRRGVS
jgi:hypothetical protein